MYSVPIRTSRITSGIGVALLALVILGAAYWHAHPSGLTAAAYTAAVVGIRHVSSRPESLHFSVLGLDEAATCYLEKDGNYVATGWVEQTNEHGRRVHRDWKSIVHHNDGTNWTCVYLKLDRFVYGTDTEE